jgi:hypothetical protein
VSENSITQQRLAPGAVTGAPVGPSDFPQGRALTATLLRPEQENWATREPEVQARKSGGMISSLYFHSESPGKPLRIGVLVDAWELPTAFRRVLTDIESSDFARLELVVFNCQPPGAPAPKPAISRYLRSLLDPERRRLLLYGLYSKFDQRHVRSPNPLGSVNCADILGSCPRMDVVPITKRFVHRFPPEAVAELRSHNIDVLLRFGFNILRGDVLTSAKYGVWSFHHGDNDFYRGGPALFWEIVENNPSSGVILQVLTEKLDDGSVLCKSRFSTERGLSRSRNIFYPYWGSAHFVIRKLHQLHERGWELIKQQVIPPAPYQGKTAIYRSPTNMQMVKWLAPTVAGKLLRRPFQREKVHHWRVCLRRADSSRLVERAAGQSGNQWVSCERGHSYADPFLLQRHGQLWLFFEDYLYGEKRGRICCAPVKSDLSIGTARVCLDLPYHLSYPFVFQHEGEVFMIPESAANGTIDLYRAAHFPTSWKREKTLFRATAVDTTPIHHAGRWYFFTTLREPAGNAAFGAVFSADHLTSDWIHHPSSPISCDVSDARSAGAIEWLDGRLLRPVQDCKESYGRRIVIKEILELTPETYKDRALHSIEPDWERGLQGTHTYSYAAGVEALDAITFEPPKRIL